MKSKIYLCSLLATMMAMLVSLTLVSCGDDDDELEQTENLSVNDPEGTVVVNITNDNGTVDIETGEYRYSQEEVHTGQGLFTLVMHSNNNFGISYAYSVYGGCSAEIVSVGKVSGLSAVKNIPESGWSQSVAVVPGTGYIVRLRVPIAYTSRVSYGYTIWDVPTEYDYCYARIYVVEYMNSTGGGIMGATIKYQGDWKVPTGK